MEPDDIREETSKFYEDRIKYFGGTKMPPWAVRKATDMARCILHPEILGILSILSLCSKESILQNQQLLHEYLYRTFGLSDEIVQTWLLYFVTRDIHVLDRFTQIDPIRFYNDGFEIAGSDAVSTLAYGAMKQNQKIYWKHLDLHIGFNSTQEDVIWFVKRYWNDRLKKSFNDKQLPQKRNRELFRNSTIYYLHKSGRKVAEIRKYINKEYDADLDDSYIRKMIKEFTPERDWFVKSKELIRQDETLRTFFGSLDAVTKIEEYIRNLNTGLALIYDLEFDEVERNFLLKRVL